MWWLNTDDSESKGTLSQSDHSCYYKTSLCALLSYSFMSDPDPVLKTNCTECILESSHLPLQLSSLQEGRGQEGGTALFEDWSERCKNGKTLQGRHIPISSHPDHEIQRKLFLYHFPIHDWAFSNSTNSKTRQGQSFGGYYDPIINVIKAVVRISTASFFLQPSYSLHFLPV